MSIQGLFLFPSHRVLLDIVAQEVLILLSEYKSEVEFADGYDAVSNINISVHDSLPGFSGQGE